MKIAVTRKTLHNAIKLVAAFTKTNKAIPILETVCLRPTAMQNIEVCTTNLECTGISTIPYDLIDAWGDEETRGICIPCGTLLKTIEKMPEEDDNLFIETEPESGKTHFYNASKSRNFSFSTIYADMEYGDNLKDWELLAKLSSDIWLNLLKKAIPCTSDDFLKQAMMCIRIESEKTGDCVLLRSVATDAHCLCVNHEATSFFAGNETIEGLLPKEAIAAILPHLNGSGAVELLECKSKYSFRFVSGSGILTEILFNKLDAKFPDYRNVIPSIRNAKASILCNRKSLSEAVKRSGLYTNNITHLMVVNFDTEKNLIEIESEDANATHSMKETISAGITKLNSEIPDSFLIGLNNKLLLRLLNSINSEEIMIYYYSEKSALLIEDADVPFEEIPSKEHTLQQRFVLMPIMLGY